MERLFGSGVVKTFQGSVDIARHGDIHGFVDVIPFELHAKVVLSSFVHSDGVVFFQGVDEVLEVFFPNIFDPKIIIDQCEPNRFGVMFP